MRHAHQRRRKGRAQLLLLAALFMLPLAAALLWSPGKYINHGELIEPPRALHDIVLHDREGGVRSFAEFAGQWLLVFFKEGACDRSCERNLYNTRQLRLTQGHHAGRVSLLLIRSDDDELSARLRAAYPDTRVWRSEAQTTARLRRVFAPQAGAVYLVDPFGNLMMQFDADVAPELIRKDLKRLLKYSGVR